MTFRVIVIPADIDQPLREETQNILSEELGYQLSFLQKLVGGYVERVVSGELVRGAQAIVSGIHYRNRPTLLVDEEGLLKNKPINVRASVFYPSELYHLHGDAVVIWENGEDWATLPSEFTIDHLAGEIARLLKRED